MTSVQPSRDTYAKARSCGMYQQLRWNGLSLIGNTAGHPCREHHPIRLLVLDGVLVTLVYDSAPSIIREPPGS